jgi:hypothetical protein
MLLRRLPCFGSGYDDCVFLDAAGQVCELSNVGSR